MPKKNKQLLLSSIASVVREIYGEATDDRLEANLRRCLDRAIDECQPQSRPIRGANATILIADIRGFTALTESLPPRLIISLLNRFFTIMGDLIEHHGGMIDKFMGDAVMAIFGAPVQHPDDLLRALACAVEMQQAMCDMNRNSEARGEPRLYAGIAINTGQVMAGSFGSRAHNEYTVIGDAVNLASRIEGYSLRGQVLLSEDSYAAARAHIEVGSVNQVMVKGKAKPVTIYELSAVTYPRRLEVPQVEIRKSPRVRVEFPVLLRRVESKRILAEYFIGQANDLGYFGMSADLPVILAPFSEVLLTLSPELGSGTVGDVYARVLSTRSTNGVYRTTLEFSDIDTPGHRRVKRFVDHMLWRR